MDIDEALNICLKNGIKIYPAYQGRVLRLCVEIKGKKKLGKDVYSQKKANDKQAQLLIHYAKKLTQ